MFPIYGYLRLLWTTGEKNQAKISPGLGEGRDGRLGSDVEKLVADWPWNRTLGAIVKMELNYNYLRYSLKISHDNRYDAKDDKLILLGKLYLPLMWLYVRRVWAIAKKSKKLDYTKGPGSMAETFLCLSLIHISEPTRPY